MALIYPPADEITACYLKLMIDNRNTWPSHFLESKDLYCVNPWKFFLGDDGRLSDQHAHKGRYFFVKRTEDSGKTDRCEDGDCWRVMGRDKLIKSEDDEQRIKILGFKKVLKFCVKNKKRKSRFTTDDETLQRKIDNNHKKVWVMEEYRLASKSTQDYVICKIRRLGPKALKFMLSKHIRG